MGAGWVRGALGGVWGRRWVAVFAVSGVVGALLAPAVVVSAQDEGVVPGPGGEFSDLGDAGVLEGPVRALASEGVLAGTGCGGGRLCPSWPILRWEVAVWLVRLLDGADPGPGGSRFEDVDDAAWWAAHVERLAELGVTLGCSQERAVFCPDDRVTREQMAAFLVRAFGLGAALSAGFGDTARSFAVADIDALFAAGITVGCSGADRDGLLFCPRDPTTRAQMAAFLHRARSLPEAEPDPEAGSGPGPGGSASGPAGAGGSQTGGSPTTTTQTTITTTTTTTETTTTTVATQQQTLSGDPAEPSFARRPDKDLDALSASGNRQPKGLWSDGTTLWVADLDDARLYAYDLATLARDPAKDVTTLAAAGNADPRGLWSDGTTVWVADQDDKKVYAYDLAGGSRDASKDIGSLLGPSDNTRLGVWPEGVWSDGSTMWVVGLPRRWLYAYNLQTEARSVARDITSLAGAQNHDPEGLWSDGETVWVADDDDGADDRIYAYDLHSGQRRQHLDFDTLAAAGNNHPRGLWSDGRTMWVADAADAKVYAYDMPPSAALESLDLSDAGIGAFAPFETGYSAHVPNTVEQITVTAAALFATSTVVISPADADGSADGHQVDLGLGDNTITVTVTNGAGTRTYTVAVTRVDAAALSDDAALSSLSLSGIDFGTFSAAVADYGADVANGVASTTVAASASHTDAFVTIDPPDADAVAGGHQIALAAGANPIAVTVESSDGTTVKTYTVTVNRESTAAFGWRVLSDFTTLDPANAGSRAIWSDGITVWIADRSGRLFAYDWSTRARVAAKDVTTLGAAGNDHPSGLWSDGETIWVADHRDGTVYAYDLDTGVRRPGREIATLAAAGNNDPSGLWSDGTTVWVADNYHDHVYAYDLHTGARRAGRDVCCLWRSGNNEPSGLWSDGETLWVADLGHATADYGDDRVFAYDLAAGDRRPTRDFDVLAAVGNRSPKGLWSDGETMWVTDPDDDRVYSYNMEASAVLRSLEVAGVNIGTFVPRTTSYQARLPAGLTQTTVAAAAASGSAAVVVSPPDADAVAAGHQVDLGTGDATITITVTNDALTETYTVELTRTSLATLTGDATLAGLSLGGLDIGPFAATTTGYRSDVADEVAAATVAATSSDPGASVTVEPPDADLSTPIHDVDLNEGVNTITVDVESSDGTRSKTYTVTVNRASAAAFGWRVLSDLAALDPSDQPPVAIWSDGTTVWVVDDDFQGNDTIHAYGLASKSRDPGKDIDLAAENDKPKGLWSDGTTVWVTDYFDQMVYAYDLGTGTRRPSRDIAAARLHAAGNDHPKGLWSDGATMWVADYADAKIYAYDLATAARRAAQDIDTLGLVGNDHAAGLWSDGRIMWVVDDDDAMVYAYFLATGARTNLDFTTLTAAGNGSPSGLWSNGTIMWVADAADGRLYSYNMPANATLTSLELAGVDIGPFSPHAGHYEASVAGTLAQTTVTARAAFSDSVVEILPGDADASADDHQVDLAAGETTITITVTNGIVTRAHTVVVTRSG